MTNSNKDILSNLSKYKPFTHHPDCDLYSHHLVRFFGYPICLGCFFVCIGFILGIMTYLFFLQEISGQTLYIIGVVMYLPTIIQFKVQYKIFKTMSRSMLGIGVMFLFISLFKYDWGGKEFVLKSISIFIFFIVLKLTLKVRNRFMNDPCVTCNRGKYPFCTHKLQDIKRLSDQIPESSAFSKFMEATIEQLENPNENIIDFDTIK